MPNPAAWRRWRFDLVTNPRAGADLMANSGNRGGKRRISVLASADFAIATPFSACDTGTVHARLSRPPCSSLTVIVTQLPRACDGTTKNAAIQHRSSHHRTKAQRRNVGINPSGCGRVTPSRSAMMASSAGPLALLLTIDDCSTKTPCSTLGFLDTHDPRC